MIAPVKPKLHTEQMSPHRRGPLLKIDQVDKSFERGGVITEVLKDVNLSIESGEFVSIIGHSGCGKSTLLNLVAGLTQVSSGAVLLEDREVNSPGPDRAVVFQNHSLLPWLSVYDNVRLAVDKVFGSSKPKNERHDWTMHNLELVQMGHAKDKRPGEISGGMKQRVGIARALSMEPKVLLMDEPFGALDALTRAHLQETVMQIHTRLGNTAIMITHDVDEAVLLSDRIVMMTNGPSARIGEILDVDLPRPRNRVELAKVPAYLSAREAVLKFLYERHRFVEAVA
jgi:nitrate/nitrite transport system ATP-binding protein